MKVKQVPIHSADDEHVMLPMAEVFFPWLDSSIDESTLLSPSLASSKDAPHTGSTNFLSPDDHIVRFAPYSERSFTTQMKSLSKRERSCVEILRQQWEADNQPLPGIVFLRFARFYNYNIKAARKGFNSFDKRYFTLSIAKVGPMLQSKTIFPVPGLKSKDGLDIFYMRPSRYFPSRMHEKYIIDNLAYVMSTMVEKETCSTNGIGFLACMDDWTMENFATEYCLKFMQMLQGGVPARVSLMLIVNPPTWFGMVWKLMKPMLAPRFRRKVKMIPESKLSQHLASGYEEFLPNDMQTGKASTRLIVKDFIEYRRQVESRKHRV